MFKLREKLADDAKDRLLLLIEYRLPWLVLGLIFGIFVTIFSSKFELLLSKNISLAYFIPVVVYMADALGTQTETIYVRNLAREKVKISTYLFKELLIGLVLGALFGFGTGVFAYIIFKEIDLSLTVAIAMFISMSIAPVVALIVPAIFQKEHSDPAVGAGPVKTVVQDLISIVVYFLVASFIVLH